MRRFLAIVLLVAAAFGVGSMAPPAAKAGGVHFGVGIGLGYGYPIFRPRYYYPGYGYRRRFVRPRYYRPRYYRPRRAYRSIRRSPIRRRFSAAHYGYCSSKYRSYRARDNTFQPYHGPRKQCRSRF